MTEREKKIEETSGKTRGRQRKKGLERETEEKEYLCNSF